MKRHLSNPYLVVPVIAMLIRLILFFYSYGQGTDSFLLSDSYRYLSLGENYFEQGFYAEKLTDPVFESVFTPPGAPFVFYYLNLIGGIPGIILFHIVLQTIIAVLILKITELVFIGISKKQLFIPGLIYALDIPSIVMGNVVMTETLFTFFSALFIFQFIRFLKEKHSGNLIYASLFLGIAALVRPIIIYFPISLIFLLIILFRKETIRCVRYLACALIPFYFITGIWVLRNHNVHEAYFFSYQGDFNSGYYQASTIYSDKYGISLKDAREKFYSELKEELKVLEHVDQIVFYDAFGKKAIRVISENPELFLKNMLKAQINLFFRPIRDYLKITTGSKELFHTRSKNHNFTVTFLTYWQILLNITSFALLSLGLYYFYLHNKSYFLLFAIFLIYFMLVCSGPEIEARFRVPIFPVIIILIIGGMMHIKEKILRRMSTIDR